MTKELVFLFSTLMPLIVVLVGLYALPPVLSLAEKSDLKGLTADALKLTDILDFI